MNNELTLPCQHCGNLNRPNAKSCRSCGKPIANGTPTKILAPAQMAGQKTAPLPPTTAANGFADLPLRALVHDRYEILQSLWSSKATNTYQVGDETQPGNYWYLFEAANPNEFQGAQLILDKQITHPAIARTGEVFREVQYDNAERGYMTMEFPLRFASDQMRVGETEVLKYGIELGGALEAVHRAGLAHNNIQLASIALHNGKPKLAHFGLAAPLTPETRQRDIYNLAHALQLLITPPGQTVPPQSPTGAILQRALVPNTPQSFATAGEFAAACQDALENIRRPKSINLNVGKLTDVGVRRELNEDAFAMVEYARAIQKGGQALGLFVVSDGMGGAAAGEIASQIVTDRMMQEFNQTIAPMFSDGAKGQPDYGALLKAAGEKASRAVYDERSRLRNDMGATLAAALVVGMQAYLINVGDSRGYLLRGESMKKITKDHSLVQSLVDANQLREDEVRTHPQRNIITRSIGEKANITVDLFTEPLKVGDVLFLCSDGMWEMADDQVVRQMIQKAPTPQAAVRSLIDLANANGGDDNITCILVRIEDASAAKK
ncbi:MAG: hypothetical protein B6D41_01520 [Chloroflexi bacterium UTCFX4]|jgi:serine/threonine protein phosphatase PrpC|nr:MAG: hypothetical protein B6D41_01520 [Chloroflexi bacterium UTCFX4]